MNYQGLGGKSAYALCRIYYRHLPFRCLDLPLPCSGMALHLKEAVVWLWSQWEMKHWQQQEGLCCISPEGAAENPPTFFSSIKCLVDLAYFHFQRLIFPQLFLETDNMEPELVPAVDLPQYRQRGQESSEFRPAKALVQSQVLFPYCAVLKQLVQCLLRESYFGMPVFLSQGRGFPRSSSWCGCLYDQRPFESVPEYNRKGLVTWWP